MADRILYEYTGDPLTPKIDKLREERIRLAQWAKRLRADEQADADKPTVGGDEQGLAVVCCRSML